tara:strand:+ start:8104 stop:9036 length:933 start_codon:yes stop_codon:yes gene_type:complete
MGVQGAKRKAAAGRDVVATVDPLTAGADFNQVKDVPLDGYDAALLCVPDDAKFELIEYLLSAGKHVLVEKPLLAIDDSDLERLSQLAARSGKVCYTAYNHRFEPHFIRMRDLLRSGELGRIYSVRMFYGNGTARLVRESAWRDKGAGVLPDLGSHLLDTLRFWFGAAFSPELRIQGAFRHENRAFDHVILGATEPMAIQLEMSMVSWRNHHSTDVFAEQGSAHISSLCKWGPSTFTHRRRILPSGTPPEESVTLVQGDPTWDAEYRHFVKICKTSPATNGLETDIWLNKTLRSLSESAGVPSISSNGSVS